MQGLCIPILLAVVTQPASPTTLTGIVQDDAGRPIAGANVFLSTALRRKGIGVLYRPAIPTAASPRSATGGASLPCGTSTPISSSACSWSPAASRDLHPQARRARVGRGPHRAEGARPRTPQAGARRPRAGRERERRSRRPRDRRAGRRVRGRGGRFGALGELGIDALAVTDDDGTFRLGVGEDGDALYLLVKASFLAPERTKPIAAGPTVHTIRSARASRSPAGWSRADGPCPTWGWGWSRSTVMSRATSAISSSGPTMTAGSPSPTSRRTSTGISTA